MMQNSLHIVLSSDENYAEFVAVVIVSLFETNKNHNICVHLLSNNIQESTIAVLRKHVPQDRGELLVYDISNTREKLNANLPTTISIASYSRLLVQNLLPQEIDRILYVDTDVVFNGDISSLWEIDLQGCYVAGVSDIWPGTKMKRMVGLSEFELYINAGVLLINLRAWREDDLESKIIEFLNNHNGVIYHHDQGIINGVCKGRKLKLHPQYNTTSNFFSHPYKYAAKNVVPFYSEEEFEQAKYNPRIIHFTPGLFDRPWTSSSKHPLLHIYETFHNKTEWKNAPKRKAYSSFPLRVMRMIYTIFPFEVYSFISKQLEDK